MHVNQWVTDRMKYEQSTTTYAHDNKALALAQKRVRAPRARRKLVYGSPQQSSVLVQPNWNPATATVPIYLSPINSGHGGSFPSAHLGGQNSIDMSAANGSIYGGYGTTIHTSPLHSTPKFIAESTCRNPPQTNKIFTPSKGGSPKNKNYHLSRSKNKGSRENLTRIGNNLYMTEYF